LLGEPVDADPDKVEFVFDGEVICISEPLGFALREMLGVEAMFLGVLISWFGSAFGWCTFFLVMAY